MNYTEQTLRFIEALDWDDLPQAVQHQSKRCLLDALGAMIAGHKTPVGALMEQFVEDQFPGDQATVLVSGKRASASGAVLVNGFAQNALDIDDGYRPTMGHIGAATLPVILGASEVSAAIGGRSISGNAFLTAMVVGYEIGARVGLIRHATYETYHSSGSWGAISGAAAASKLMGLSSEQLRHAMGAAEYHAPIAPMMKCIDVPSMGKDSLGWGCMVAMMSTLMAQRGFTGIQPLFDDTPNPEWITSLGNEWEILNIYFKPYSACRWAQPGVDGALKLMGEYGISPNDIVKIRVYTFKESAALSQAHPQNTEEAQYNIPFPIAAAILDGEVGPAQNLPPRLFDSDIRQMMDKIEIIAQERFQTAFPSKAESEVEIVTRSGQTLNSGVMSARWDANSPYSATDLELKEKFQWLTSPILGHGKSEALQHHIWNHFDQTNSLDRLFELCTL